MAYVWNGILCNHKIKRGNSLQSDIKPSPALNEKKTTCEGVYIDNGDLQKTWCWTKETIHKEYMIVFI